MNSQKMEAYNILVNIAESIESLDFSANNRLNNPLLDNYSAQLNNMIMPDVIEPSYTGIHLKNNFDDQDFLKMVESFKNGKILHAKYALQILTKATRIFEVFPNICYFNFKKHKMSSCIIAGDLHGSFKDLGYIIQKYGIPGKSYCFIFNGDFVDRGPNQCEILLTLLYSIILYPGRVFMNRGNHEDIFMNLMRSPHPNFKNDTELKYNKYSLALFNEAQRLFRRLPLATVIENNVGKKYFIVHGGISCRLDLEFVANLNRFKFNSVNIANETDPMLRKISEQIIDMLWSDPLISQSGRQTPMRGCMFNSNRGTGCLFARDISEEFCKKNGFSAIIRSHQVRPRGISQDHPFCYTIFSSSNYNGGNNNAAVIIINANESIIRYHSFNNVNNLSNDSMQKVNLIDHFKMFLEKESPELTKKFESSDDCQNCLNKVTSWADTLSKHIATKTGITVDPKHFIALKDELCPCMNSRLNSVQQRPSQNNDFLSLSELKLNEMNY